MKSFAQIVSETIREHGHVHVLFEQGMYFLAEDLERILQVLREAGAPFEVIGGLAVNAHLMSAFQRSRSFLTRDIDFLVRRSDLDQIVRSASEAGYQAKKMMGGYALLLPGQQLSEAVHLLFAGEKPKSSYPVLNPQIRPEEKELFGFIIPVAPLIDLLILKLNSLRPKDLVHLEVLDEVGFITPEIESELPEELRSRLQDARTRFEHNQAQE
jgi:hypothetical protein